VTNGVHARTWLAPELGELLRRVGVRPEAVDEEARWESAENVDPAELWRVHVDRRRALVAEAGRRLGGGAGLDPDALTIAFARRFATYKRGGLLLSDVDRLERLLADDGRPVQILVAGKSHPADEGGKDVIRRITAFRADARSHGRVLFLEDYDMALARMLVQGADVWLNNPRRPYEASGTSGMKSALNGGLNLSVLDGWWCEGYSADVGWAFGGGDAAADEGTQDARDAEELFALLERDVVPTFYDRDESGLPARWTAMMRASIARLGGRFGSNRMLREYAEQLYLPAHRAR
jgi:glycogen phosphorylase